MYGTSVPAGNMVLGMECGLIDYACSVHIDEHDVGIRANVEHAFLRKNIPDLCWICCAERDETFECKTTARNFGEHQWKGGLHAKQATAVVPNIGLGLFFSTVGSVICGKNIDKTIV